MQSMSDSDDELSLKPIKLIVIGDGTCGKTSLINQFIHRNCSNEYEQTVGVDFYLKHVYFEVNKKSIKVQVWDVGGQNLGGSMMGKYLCGSHGILLVYDIMNLKSFENLEDWMDVTRKLQLNNINLKTPHLALVANKCDMEHMRAVKVEAHQRYAEANNLSSHFVSAKTGESVILCFHKIIAEILDINLGKVDYEDQTVVSAKIVHQKVEASFSSPNDKTTICVLQ